MRLITLDSLGFSISYEQNYIFRTITLFLRMLWITKQDHQSTRSFRYHAPASLIRQSLIRFRHTDRGLITPKLISSTNPNSHFHNCTILTLEKTHTSHTEKRLLSVTFTVTAGELEVTSFQKENTNALHSIKLRLKLHFYKT